MYLNQCSKSELERVFSPIADLPNSSNKAEIISHCLNQELGGYWLKSYTLPGLINDEKECLRL